MRKEKPKTREIPADVAAFFPKMENFFDCTGHNRPFMLDIRADFIGFTIVAREVTEGSGGYEFDTWTEGNVFIALGDLRLKIKRGLATRYLYEDRHGIHLTHDRLKGNIDSRGLMIDGKLIDWDTMIKIMSTYEGYYFDLRLHD